MLPASKKISDDGALGATALSFSDERVVRVVEFAAVARANGLFVRRRCWLLLAVKMVLSLVVASLIKLAEGFRRMFDVAPSKFRGAAD